MTDLNFKNFILEEKDGIAVFTLNRPEVRNALSNECWGELARFFKYADKNENIRVVIVTGAGDKAFAAGADIKGLRDRNGVDMINAISREALLLIENNSKPVIAAVNGVAFGGGFELALACDIRIVANHIKFGLPETNLGIIPGAGGTQRLTRIVGLGKAKEIVIGGKVLNAEEAVSSGLAIKNVPLENLLDEAIELARTILAKGPLALNLAKKALNASMFTDLNTGLLLENLAFGILLDSEDKYEGTTAFLEKRKANFKGK